MVDVIESYEQHRDEFVILTLRDLRRLFISKGFRLVGQLKECKDNLSRLNYKYFQDQFKASEV
jgi:hypothetical protein